MALYLATGPEGLRRARAITPRLAHMAYRLGPGSQLLAAALPEGLRGGLMLLADWDCPPVEEPRRLARQLTDVCLRRSFAGVVLDWEEPVAPDRAALLAQLEPLLRDCGRTLYVPEHYAAAAEGALVLIGTAISGGTLTQRLEQAVRQYGPHRLALDLERLRMDFPLPCPSGQGQPLSAGVLEQLRQGQSVFYSDALCARYFTRSGSGGTHMVLFDDAQTLRRKLALGRDMGIRDALVMLPEAEDIAEELFRGEG